MCYFTKKKFLYTLYKKKFRNLILYIWIFAYIIYIYISIVFYFFNIQQCQKLKFFLLHKNVENLWSEKSLFGLYVLSMNEDNELNIGLTS